MSLQASLDTTVKLETVFTGEEARGQSKWKDSWMLKQQFWNVPSFSFQLKDSCMMFEPKFTSVKVKRRDIQRRSARGCAPKLYNRALAVNSCWSHSSGWVDCVFGAKYLKQSDAMVAGGQDLTCWNFCSLRFKFWLKSYEKCKTRLVSTVRLFWTNFQQRYVAFSAFICNCWQFVVFFQTNSAVTHTFFSQSCRLNLCGQCTTQRSSHSTCSSQSTLLVVLWSRSTLLNQLQCLSLRNVNASALLCFILGFFAGLILSASVTFWCNLCRTKTRKIWIWRRPLWKVGDHDPSKSPHRFSMSAAVAVNFTHIDQFFAEILLYLMLQSENQRDDADSKFLKRVSVQLYPVNMKGWTWWNAFSEADEMHGFARGS